jgi:aubergine-like protein
MTGYNRKTYRVDDIKWDMSPKSTFKSSSDQGKGTEKTDEEVTYMEYYRVRYDQKITNPGQPLLVSLPRRKDHHRGTGPIYLIPELCQMTGLTDEMRVNNTLMQEVSTHLHMAPTVRHDKITGFMGRLQGSPEVRYIPWNLTLAALGIPLLFDLVEILIQCRKYHRE